tara:strand:+ start:1542 stop:1766 length:225 start_codon:yes stop_codon:yes gene_type:complete
MSLVNIGEEWERRQKENKLKKMKYPMKAYKLELLKYFYENQYDEERFPHFRACDFHNEMSYEGNEIPTYIFYND